MKWKLTLAGVLFTLTAYCQSPTYTVLNIEDDGDYSSLRFLDTTNSRFYFTSEAHGIASNPKQFLKVFTYLYDNKNVRTIVLERSHSVAYLLTRYFETEDTTYLRKAVWFQDDFDMYLALKKHIKKEPINIIGNDAERYFNCLVDALLDLAIKTNLKDVNSRLLQSLQDATKLKATKKEILPIVAAFKEQLKQPAFTATDQHVLENISAIVNNPCFKNGKALYIISEEDKYELFKRYSGNIQNGNYLSQYGVHHTRLAGGRWANLLQHSNDSPFKGAVYSMGVHFFNSHSYYNHKSAVSQVLGANNTYHSSSGNLKKKDETFFSSLQSANSFVFFPEKGEYNYHVILIYKNQEKMQPTLSSKFSDGEN